MSNFEIYPVINFNPLTTTEASLGKVIALMSQARASYILVLTQDNISNITYSE